MKRLHIRLREDEYQDILEAARIRQLTVSDWVRQALRSAIDLQGDAGEAKLRAIANASKHTYPTADIETMLGEIEAGRGRP